MNACIFCRIVNGDIPAKIVHEDAESVAFEDINAKAPVHLLVIPKRHIASVQDCQAEDQALLGHLLVTCSRVANSPPPALANSTSIRRPSCRIVS